MKIVGVKKDDFITIQSFYKNRERHYSATVSIGGRSTSKDKLTFLISNNLADGFRPFDSSAFIQQLKQFIETRHGMVTLYGRENFELRIEAMSGTDLLSLSLNMDNSSTVFDRKGQIFENVPPSFHGRFLIGRESAERLVDEFEKLFT